MAVLNNTKDAKRTVINNFFPVTKIKFRNYSGVFLHSLVKVSCVLKSNTPGSAIY